MEKVFSKTDFPRAPGGHGYVWKEAAASFEASLDEKYVIAITASASNSKSKNNTDDDDLRLALDGYEFGKYEVHDEKISWKGYGTASSWDGATLKGGDQTIYFFVELRKGRHMITFFADNTPSLKEIQIFRLVKNEKFTLDKAKPIHAIATSRKGVPWMSFVFLGVKPKKFSIASTVKSATQKKTSDGDNLKVIVNGKIRKNSVAATSNKYKNFFFSGDINKGKSTVLALSPEDFVFLEDSVELWYDESPSVYAEIEVFENLALWLETGIGESAKLIFYELVLQGIVRFFSAIRFQYSSTFLEHSLRNNPKKLIFENDSDLAKKIKKDKSYPQIQSLIQQRILNGIFNGEINLGGDMEVNFEKGDLYLSLHGLKKIEYKASPKGEGSYKVQIRLFDMYDFDPKEYSFKPTWLPIHMADVLEASFILKNFEIEINIFDILYV